MLHKNCFSLFSSISAASILLLVGSVSAQDTVDCGDALSDNAIDKTSVSIAQDLVSKLQVDICSQDFASVSSAQSYARSGGATLNVPGYFDFSLTDNKKRENAAWSIKDTKFCNLSSNELIAKATNEFRQSSARFALDAFSKCVAAQQSGLFMSYSILEDGSLLVADLTRKVSGNTSLAYDVYSLGVTTATDTSVTCSLRGRDAVNKQNIEATLSGSSEETAVNAAKAQVTCAKVGDGFAAITIPTSEIDFTVVMPSKAQADASALEEVKRALLGKIAAVEDSSVKSQESSGMAIDRLNATVDTQIAAVSRSIKAARAFVSSQKFSVVSKKYSCNAAANKKLIGCPRGYVNTRSIFYNTYPGGSCGQGTVNNICVQK